MLVPARAIVDPASDRLDLFFAQVVLRRGRRLPHVLILRRDALIELRFRPVARRDHARFSERALLRVEAQLRLALILVRPVTGEAIVRQYRTNLAIEIDRYSTGSGGDLSFDR